MSFIEEILCRSGFRIPTVIAGYLSTVCHQNLFDLVYCADTGLSAALELGITSFQNERTFEAGPSGQSSDLAFYVFEA